MKTAQLIDDMIILDSQLTAWADEAVKSWRFQIASAIIPTLCLLSLTIPESPRFLLKKGRLGEAYESLLALRGTPLLAARELYYANAQIQAEVSLLPRRVSDTEVAAKTSPWAGRESRTRR